MDNTDCVDFAHKKRTDGDGMESNVVAANEFETKINISQEPKIVQKSHNDKSNKFRLIELTPPKTMVFDKKKRNIYSKGPKFVPYEPYTAAIKPIIPNNKQIANFKKRSSRNNLDINVLISQMSQIDTNPSEFKKKVKNMTTSDSSKNRENMEWTSEKVDMQKQIDELSRENETLKDQIKQQAQVNKELKTMLVASMGEDLETQVQSLNDDKRHLANALLSSAQHLSTHQEQTEWLAGQCEVWRSKFLASSLMVEELAGWKRALNQRTEELHQVLRQILEERCRARDLVLYTYRNLYTLHDGWLANIAFNEVQIDNCKILFDRSLGSVNLNASKPETANLLDLASANLKLSENLSCGIEKCDDSKLNLAGLPVMTEVESAAEKLLATPLEVSRNHDLPMNALVYHAHSKSSGTPPVACCTHCNGQVQLL